MSDDRKTVILTGASRGIGHATVKRFSGEGWRIITCSREDVPAECLVGSARHRHIVADLGDTASIQALVSDANALPGHAPLHRLVPNPAPAPT